jgi:hypothetical protein
MLQSRDSKKPGTTPPSPTRFGKKPAATTSAAKSRPAPASTKTWTATHTAWGDPELQGVWEGFENLPLERPLALGDKEFFTDAELADRVAKAAARGKARDALIAKPNGLQR